MDFLITLFVDLMDLGLEAGEEKGFVPRWVAFAIRTIFWAVLEAMLLLLTILACREGDDWMLNGLLLLLLLAWTVYGVLGLIKRLRK